MSREQKAIAYAYPSSVRAETLGHGKTGCYYIEYRMLLDNGEWSAPSVWPGTEGEACAKVEPYLLSLFGEIQAEVSPYSMKA